MKPSDSLMDLIFLALDHGIDSVREGGGPLVAFMIKQGEERVLVQQPQSFGTAGSNKEEQTTETTEPAERGCTTEITSRNAVSHLSEA